MTGKSDDAHPMSGERIYRWRRLLDPGVEVLRLETLRDQVCASGEIIDAGERPFALTYRWVLDAARRSRSLRVQLRCSASCNVVIERIGKSRWMVDGLERTDLAGCDEIDLSATPFCNTLALRRFGPPPGGAGEMTALYVSFPGLDLAPSRQRYEQAGRTNSSISTSEFVRDSGQASLSTTIASFAVTRVCSNGSSRNNACDDVTSSAFLTSRSHAATL